MKKICSLLNNHIYHAFWEDRSKNQRFKHSLIFPKNTYSPWLADQSFFELYEQIKEHTLVDPLRCYELWKLASQFQQKGISGGILEVGVWKGGTGAVLAKASSSDTIVYLCDTFTGVVKAGINDNVYRGGEHSDTSEVIVNSLIGKLNIDNTRIIKGVFPDESGEKVDCKEFKICHIDVDVYESARDIFRWVWPKLIVGGVVIFDDYGFASCEGITALVNEIELTYRDALSIYNVNGHGLIIKIGP